MKKILTYFLLLFITFWILGSNVNATTFIQKSTRQNSAAVANNDPVTVWKWNAIVLDLSNIIEDIWNLKTYIDTNIANNFVYNPATDKLENTNRDIKISKKLIINWTFSPQEIDISEWGLSDNTIFSNNIKNWTVKKEDFANNVQFWNEEYWKENGLDIYYDLWNIWIWTDTPNEKVEVKDWNIKIKTNWNGIIYPDGTLQTTAFNWITDAVTLNWNHKRDGSHANPYILSQDYKNCREIQDAWKSHWDGFYQIKPNWWKIFSVYCDMTTDWGWWTRFVNSKWDFSFNEAKKCWSWDIIDNDRLECFNPNVYNQKTTKLYLKEEWQDFFYDNSWNDTPTTNRITTTWNWNYTCKGWGVMNIMIWGSNIPTIYNANQVRFGRSFCEFWWEVGWIDSSTHYMNYDWEKQFWLPSGNRESHSKRYEFYYRDKTPINNTIILTPIEYNWIQWIDGEKKFKKDIILSDWSALKSIKGEWNAFTWNETDNAIASVEAVRNLIKNNKGWSDFVKCWGSNGWFLKYVKDYNTTTPDIPCEWWDVHWYNYDNDIVMPKANSIKWNWTTNNPYYIPGKDFKNCREIAESWYYHVDLSWNWYYKIKPKNSTFNVYCNMDYDWGWWTRFVDIKNKYSFNDAKSCWLWTNINNWNIECFNPNRYDFIAKEIYWKINNTNYKITLDKTASTSTSTSRWNYHCLWNQEYMTIMWGSNTYPHSNADNISYIRLWLNYCWNKGGDRQIGWFSNSNEYQNYSNNGALWPTPWDRESSPKKTELYIRDKIPTLSNKKKVIEAEITKNMHHWVSWSCSNKIYKSCVEIKEHNPSSINWYYTINPWSGNINVYCDMETDWGWWRRIVKENYNNSTTQSGWNWNNKITTCWEYWKILGWYNTTSTTAMDKTFSLNNVVHNQVLLKGDYIQIDSWDWEEAYVKLNNTKIYSRHYGHPTWSKQVCW